MPLGTDNLEVPLEFSGYYGGYGSGYGGYAFQPLEANEDVTLELYSYNTINLMYSYNLRVGTKSKFVFSGGYSVPLQDDVYRVKSGHILTDKSKTFINWMAPGGFIIGVKFMLGV
ncbi:hypothetical protein [Marinilabilia rubra]|uniref:Outer membrane protein beta-barrel domain-containing protein n=1 Tax=Marinilabilia rubra TaxID=2162893 RepID=A0A2U2BAT8_9BACT|nr:hypothetical protein [Marinilabilia rubra]PWE00176.1 hypothetical protein DDZ16_07430 [Marinilabilia rubra]